jgi:hypothetical protein
MTLIDFNSYKNTQAIKAPDDLDDIKLLILRFLECNSQHICGVMCPMTAQKLYDGFIVAFLADLPEMSLSERAAFINETVTTIEFIQKGKVALKGLSTQNAHVLTRLIDRLRMELPPTPEFTARLLRTVTTRHGTAHKLGEFIAFSRSARYSAAHWTGMATLAQQKGGLSLPIAEALMTAVESLDAPVAPAPTKQSATA